MQKRKLKSIWLFLFILLFSTLSSQNLVPNPSFETYTSCPNSADQLGNAKPWFKPSTGTPDYFNGCAPASTYFNVPITAVGNCLANSGVGMSGIVIIDDLFGSQIYREYLAVKLNAPLILNKKYFVTYHVRLADSARYASNQINVFFGDSINKSNFDTINIMPQVKNPSSNFIINKTSWTKLKGNFIANGGEKFLYIGDFKHPFNGDTLFVSGGNKFSYDFPYYFVDDICVSDDSLFSENWVTKIETLKKRKLTIYPNPVQSYLFLDNLESHSQLKMFDSYGEEIRIDLKTPPIDLSNLKPGIYFVICSTQDGNFYKYKLIKE